MFWAPLAMPVALGGILAAFGSLQAPQSPVAAQAPAPSRAPLSYIDNAPAALPPLTIEREIILKRGETLTQHLRGLGFSAPQQQALKAANPAVAKPVAGRTALTLSYTEGAPYHIATAQLAFRPTPVQEVKLALNGTRAQARVAEKPLTQHNAVAVGRIGSSLWADASNAGLSAEQIMAFMDIFAWDIDYTRDIHPGDSFKISYEETRNDLGQRVKTGRILGAAFTVGGETRQAFWWGKSAEYLNEKGESKRKLLLRTPLEVYRISSGFGMRTHPVLGYSKMHKGTDFAAPTGTPVKASGNGVITYLGPKGPSGNLIIIKHNGKYSTAYAHLHRFSKGLRVGSTVKQGQIIAQVGTTGRSTGPHLHYEVRVNGESVNAMSTKLPTGNPLSRRELAAFKGAVNGYQVAWRNALTNTELASR